VNAQKLRHFSDRHHLIHTPSPPPSPNVPLYSFASLESSRLCCPTLSALPEGCKRGGFGNARVGPQGVGSPRSNEPQRDPCGRKITTPRRYRTGVNVSVPVALTRVGYDRRAAEGEN
jgi:hypothetical protein